MIDNNPRHNTPPSSTEKGINRRTASLLSLCQKAGKLVCGEVAVEKALSSGKALLVIICADASERTKKKFTNKTFFYKVKNHVCFMKDEISRNIGKNNIAVVAVVDEGFANAINEML